MTTKILKKIDIFISSPSDVVSERNAIRWAIEILNRAIFIGEGYLLFPLAYEELVPPVIGQSPQITIDHFMNEPDQCYMLICVLWMRMGTSFTHPRTNQEYQSGTEYEFVKAYEANKRAGKPLILLYRRRFADAHTGNLEQKERVAAFFERFGSSGGDFLGLYQQYSSLDDFRDLVLLNIVDVMRRHPPEGMFDSVERPEMIEEERRLDAAIPKAARVYQPTELWVQLCVPNSPGFREELPQERISDFALSQEDIGEGSLGVAFSVDPKTGLPESTILSIEVVSPDFDLPTPQMALEIVHGKDSARLLFSMVPKTERARSIVHVHVKQRMPEGVDVLVASVALYTEIVTVETSSPVWSVIRRPLRTLQALFSPKAELMLVRDEMLRPNRQAYKRMMAEHVTAEIAELVGKLNWWGSWDEEPTVAATLRQLGQQALPGCLQALRYDRKEWGAIRALKELGTGVASLLAAALEDSNATMRRNAAYALGRIGGELSVGPLVVALSDPDSAVRSAAATALSEIGHKAGPRAVDPLTNALTDREPSVRSAAAKALGSIGDSRAVAALISCLFDDDVQVRISSSDALYWIGDTAVQSIRAAGTEVIEALVGIEEAETTIYASNGWLLKAVGEPAVGPLIAALRRCKRRENYIYSRITGVLRSIGTPTALMVLGDCK